MTEKTQHHARTVDRLDTARSGTPRQSGGRDGLRLGERVAALRERLETRADARAAAQLRADVTEARGFVRGFDARDVSAATAARYVRAVEQMRREGRSPEAARCRSTFTYERAAVVHVTRGEVKAALRDLDKHRRTGDLDKAAAAYGRVRSGLDTLRRYPPTTGSREADMRRSSAFQGPMRAAPERSNGKRASLASLPAGWRDMVQHEARAHDRAPLAAMAATGCRPVEVKGIRVRQDESRVTLTIRGAKVDDTRGVDTRELAFDRTSLAETQAGRDLLDWLGERSQRTMAHQGSADAFRERVSRAADRAGLPQVSAYTYRHATARELKATGSDRSEIANRLGHRGERSQRAYG